MEDVIAHTNLYWQFQSATGRHAATVESGAVSFGADHAAGIPG